MTRESGVWGIIYVHIIVIEIRSMNQPQHCGSNKSTIIAIKLTSMGALLPRWLRCHGGRGCKQGSFNALVLALSAVLLTHETFQFQ